jgi:ribosomal protein S18 acetylase RimI-like enzyme
MVTVSAHFKSHRSSGLEMRRAAFSRGYAMINYIIYHKLVVLKNGKQVMIRLLNAQDRENLINFFQKAPAEDIQFCKEDVKNPKVIDSWLHFESARKIMALIARDMATKQVVASLNLHKGQQAALNVGDIHQILVARPFQGLGLGSLMLDEMIALASEEKLNWLKVEVVADFNNIIKAFQSKGFEIRATLEDYFMDLKGEPHDAALMMRPLIERADEDF